MMKSGCYTITIPLGFLDFVVLHEHVGAVTQWCNGCCFL